MTPDLFLHRARLALIVIISVLAQNVIFPELRLWGATPSFAAVAVLAEGYREGPETGALFGFVVGLSLDLFLPTPLGLSALTLAIAGYLIGVIRTGVLRPSAFLPPLLGGFGTLLVGLLFAAIGILAGQDQFLAWRTLQIVAVSAVYSAALSPIVFPLIGWASTHEQGPEAGWATPTIQ